jgi:hypothetical protein
MSCWSIRFPARASAAIIRAVIDLGGSPQCRVTPCWLTIRVMPIVMEMPVLYDD